MANILFRLSLDSTNARHKFLEMALQKRGLYNLSSRPELRGMGGGVSAGVGVGVGVLSAQNSRHQAISFPIKNISVI